MVGTLRSQSTMAPSGNCMCRAAPILVWVREGLLNWAHSQVLGEGGYYHRRVLTGSRLRITSSVTLPLVVWGHAEFFELSCNEPLCFQTQLNFWLYYPTTEYTIWSLL